MHLPLGTLLQGGKYKIERYIGSGGFGCTYEARHVMLNNTVAIKEFFVKDYCNRDATTNRIYVATQSKEEIIERLRKKFVEEARAIFGMSHPNIVRVTDIFEENGTVYYVMDYINGSSLASVIEKRGVLGEAEAMGYIKQIASALAYVHSHNRLHLDVKPQNIMIDQSGKAVLIDFGVSKQYDEVNGENTSTLLGSTPGYAPIEQSGNGVSEFYPSTDIYALGATLYKALTGKTPLPAHQRASSKRLKELQFPEGISPATREAVECSMQLYVDNRPQSVAEFLELLKGSKDLNEETIAPKDPKDLKVSKDPKNKKIAAFIIAVLLLLGGGVIFLVTGNGGETPDIIPELSPAPVVDTIPEPRVVAEAAPVPEPSPAPVVNTDSIVAARIQAYQDSIDAVNAAQEQNRLAEQQAAEEAARLAREQQQGISTQKKVDLGLNVCWAGWNVGASSPEGYGNYYAWGETTTKSDYQYYNGNDYIDIGSNISGTRYDVACVQWGGSWRMPTKAEFEELINRCTWTWTTYNNVNGYKVTGPNGNSIFLPAAGGRFGTSLCDRGSYGYYWSGSLNESNQSHAYGLIFGSGDRYVSYYSRERGYKVRPVCDK